MFDSTNKSSTTQNAGSGSGSGGGDQSLVNETSGSIGVVTVQDGVDLSGNNANASPQVAVFDSTNKSSTTQNTGSTEKPKDEESCFLPEKELCGEPKKEEPPKQECPKECPPKQQPPKQECPKYESPKQKCPPKDHTNNGGKHLNAGNGNGSEGGDPGNSEDRNNGGDEGGPNPGGNSVA